MSRTTKKTRLARALVVTGILVNLLACCQSAQEEAVWSWQSGMAGEDYILASAADSDGHFFVAGETSGSWGTDTVEGTSDFVAAKLDGQSGVEKWRWQGSVTAESGDRINAVVVDANGDLLMGGSTTAQNGESSDFAAIKLDGESGVEVWSWQNGTSGIDSFNLAGTALPSSSSSPLSSADGHLFLAGYTYESWADENVDNMAADWVCTKLNGATGVELWRWQWGNAGGGQDLVSSLTVDSEGSPLLAGSTDDGATFMAVKLDGDTGKELWRWQSAEEYGWEFVNIGGGGTDSSGNLLLGGAVSSGGSWNGEDGAGEADFMAVKLNSITGDKMWRWQGGTAGEDEITAVAVDASDNLLLAGATAGDWATGDDDGDSTIYSTPGQYGFDFAALKLDGETGVEIARWQGGSGNRGGATSASTDGADADRVKTIAVDSASGNILLAGFTYGSLADVATAFGDRDGGDDADFAAIMLSASALETPATTPVPTPVPTLLPTLAPALNPPTTTATTSPSAATITTTPVTISPATVSPDAATIAPAIDTIQPTVTTTAPPTTTAPTTTAPVTTAPTTTAPTTTAPTTTAPVTIAPVTTAPTTTEPTTTAPVTTTLPTTAPAPTTPTPTITTPTPAATTTTTTGPTTPAPSTTSSSPATTTAPSPTLMPAATSAPGEVTPAPVVIVMPMTISPRTPSFVATPSPTPSVVGIDQPSVSLGGEEEITEDKKEIVTGAVIIGAVAGGLVLIACIAAAWNRHRMEKEGKDADASAAANEAWKKYNEDRRKMRSFITRKLTVIPSIESSPHSRGDNSAAGRQYMSSRGFF